MNRNRPLSVGDREEIATSITPGTVRVIVGVGGLNLEIDTPPNERCSCDGAWLVLTPEQAVALANALLQGSKSASEARGPAWPLDEKAVTEAMQRDEGASKKDRPVKKCGLIVDVSDSSVRCDRPHGHEGEHEGWPIEKDPR